MPRKAVVLLTALMLVALCSCHKKSPGEERQAKIEKALKELKDKDAHVRGKAIDTLGRLGTKEYVDEIGKLINDLSECYIWDEAKKDTRKTTVSAKAERVLKEWGYDVEKLKEKK